MFNFFKRNPVKEDDPFRKKLTDNGKTYDEYADNDVAIKIWIPEPIEETLRELCEHFEESRARLLRCILFVYLYGRYDFEQMRSKSLGLFCESYIRYSLKMTDSDEKNPITHRSGSNTTPELGKNAHDIKLWIPLKMRDDLQELANRAEKPVSQFFREILVATLLGHRFLGDQKSLAYSAGTDVGVDKEE
jgi:hypothetical protein